MKYFFIVVFILVSSVAKSQNFSFSFEGQSRTYILHLPASYNSQNKYPLVLNLHGNGSSADAQMVYSEFNNVADTGIFIVVYPNAISAAWNCGFEMPYHSGVNDVGFLSALIDTISNNYNVDSEMVYSIGMSRGGFMSYRLACELNNKIAAIASVTGLMADSLVHYCNSTKAVPVMQIHGTADSTVIYNGVQYVWPPVESVVDYWVAKNSCNTLPTVDSILDIVNEGSNAVKYHYANGTDSSEVMFFKVINGGHTWPGAIDVPSLGNTNKDFKASTEIWNFLKRHKLKAGTVSAIDNFEQKESVSVFPNPVSDYVEINSLEEEISTIELIDCLGRVVVKHLNVHSKHKIIFLDGILDGVYIMMIENCNGEVNFHKLVVR